MAISKKRNLNEVSGKVGNTVFYELNGQFIARSTPYRHKPYTQGELANQNKYTIVNKFLKQIKDVYSIGFEFVAKGTTSNAYNKAVSRNLTAVSGERGAQYFDYAKAAISEGKLPMAKDAAVSLRPEGVHFTWNPESEDTTIFQDDQVMIMLYLLGKSDKIIFLKAGAKRAEGMELLLVEEPRHPKAHVYIAFISNNRKSISNSQYLGELDFGAAH